MRENEEREEDAMRPLPLMTAANDSSKLLKQSFHGNETDGKVLADRGQLPEGNNGIIDGIQSLPETEDGVGLDTHHSSMKNKSHKAFTRTTTNEPPELRSEDAAVQKDVSSNASSSASDVDDEEGWEDIESDTEQLSFKSFFDDATFPDLRSMLEHVRTKFSFDFVRIRRDLNLDYLETIQLVNYLRSEALQDHVLVDAPSKNSFLDHQYLQPVFDNDAVLYSLEDLFDLGFPDFQNETARDLPTSPEARIRELEARLRSAEAYIGQLEDQTKYLNGLLDEGEAVSDPQQRSEDLEAVNAYFGTYAKNDIHVEMLSDRVRTSAYERFIYENKHLFEGKVVLDVGCGTGILSMMCARAGAKQVFAVDNSDLIEKSRSIVSLNNFGEVITCVKGLVQEVTLPVDKVDVLVSEWMGYGLLSENMLEPVLLARDKYLAPGGLMVPSHATLSLAPLADGRFMARHYRFWESVYGFSMTPMDMLTDPHASAVFELSPASLAHPGRPFKTFDLHAESPAGIYAWLGSFDFDLERGVERLDGFVVWFDIFFARGSRERIPSRAADFGGVAFTTGPAGPRTHWGQCVLPIVGDDGALALEKGNKIRGTVSCARHAQWRYGTAWTAKWSMVPAAGPEKEGAMTWADRTD